MKKSTAPSKKNQKVPTPTVNPLKDWEVMMNVINPKSQRPRRLSIHAIAATIGRDPFAILKEMQASGHVLGYVCPDVRTPIFYLNELKGLPGMINTPSPEVWKAAHKKLVDYPIEKVKGFKRFAYGDDKSYTMSEPFEKDDLPYKEKVEAALKAAGF